MEGKEASAKLLNQCPEPKLEWPELEITNSRAGRI